MTATVLLEDTFEFKTVPFIVTVKSYKIFINAKTGEIRSINPFNAPAGMEQRMPLLDNWKKCNCIVGNVRPNYPYTVKEEWPENVNKHYTNVIPLETPKKSGLWIFSTISLEQEYDIEDINIEGLAQQTIDDLESAYTTRKKVKTLA